VVEYSDRKKLLVNGVQQSGPEVEGYWTFAFSRHALPTADDVKRILVVGVGGGTVIRRLHSFYPKAAMTAVDIDEAIIGTAKTYFGLGDQDWLSFAVCDAATFATPIAYDLVIVDLYVGREIPMFIHGEAFAESMRRWTAKNGTLIINYLHDGEYGNRSEILMRRLNKHFGTVRAADMTYNRFIFAQ
jgi:spermidine synthase